jgi:hypothetical protein
MPADRRLGQKLAAMGMNYVTRTRALLMVCMFVSLSGIASATLVIDNNLSTRSREDL